MSSRAAHQVGDASKGVPGRCRSRATRPLMRGAAEIEAAQRVSSGPMNPDVLLFSYGTLQDRDVQMANFGRELSGTADSLPGYSASLIPIRDPGVVATSGKTHHTIAERSKNSADEVHG